MSGNRGAFLGVILVFILGCVAGVLGASVYFNHRHAVLLQRGASAYLDGIEKRMTQNLHLDATQKAQIHQDFLENLAGRKQLQAGIQPQVQQLNIQTVREIRSVLRPDQVPLFRENLTDFRKRFGRAALKAHALDQPAPPDSAAPPRTD